jgi:BUD22
MPKRKRSTYEDDSERVSRMQKQDVQEKLTQSKKLLHRALKTAKGFERQKLGKRLKLATTNKQSEEIARINREIEALKGLDLGKVVEALEDQGVC